MEYIDFFEEMMVPERVILTRVSKLKDLEDERIRKSLANVYELRSRTNLMIGTLINAIFTQMAQTFMISRRGMIHLLKQDTHNVCKSISSEEYRLLIQHLIDRGVIEMLRVPTKKKSGVYKLVDQKLVGVLHAKHSEDFFDYQENYVLELYDRYQSARNIRANALKFKKKVREEISKMEKENGR